jgi:acyl carrier protein
MKIAPIRQLLLDALTEIAPEIDTRQIETDKFLRDQVDLDSADWLNFLIEIKRRLGVEIPDAQASKLATLEQLEAYCASHPSG